MKMKVIPHQDWVSLEQTLGAKVAYHDIETPLGCLTAIENEGIMTFDRLTVVEEFKKGTLSEEREQKRCEHLTLKRTPSDYRYPQYECANCKRMFFK